MTKISKRKPGNIMEKEIEIFDISDKELKQTIRNSKKADKAMEKDMKKSIKQENREIRKNARKIDRAIKKQYEQEQF